MSSGEKFKTYPETASGADAEGAARGATLQPRRALSESQRRVFACVANAYLERVYAKLFASRPRRLAALEPASRHDRSEEEALQMLYMQGVADVLEEVDPWQLLSEFESAVGVNELSADT